MVEKMEQKKMIFILNIIGCKIAKYIARTIHYIVYTIYMNASIGISIKVKNANYR